MGGDGGTAASNRRYMRGVSTQKAAHLRSRPTTSSGDGAANWKTCRISDQPLSDGNVVSCDYGRLYDREAAVAHLLRRKRHKKNGGSFGGGESQEDPLGHVRGLRDLHAVEPVGGMCAPVCSVTAAALSCSGSGEGGSAVGSAAFTCSGRPAATNVPCYLVVAVGNLLRRPKTDAASVPTDAASAPTNAASALTNADLDVVGGVLSGKSIRELGADGLRSLGYDFGDAEPLMTDEAEPTPEDLEGKEGKNVGSMRLIRLFPIEHGGKDGREPSVQLKNIVGWVSVRRKREEEESQKRKEEKRADKKKRDRANGASVGEGRKRTKDRTKEVAPFQLLEEHSRSTVEPSQIVKTAHVAVARAAASNAVFSSIFMSSDRSAGMSDRERKDKLFTTNGR